MVSVWWEDWPGGARVSNRINSSQSFLTLTVCLAAPKTANRDWMIRNQKQLKETNNCSALSTLLQRNISLGIRLQWVDADERDALFGLITRYRGRYLGLKGPNESLWNISLFSCELKMNYESWRFMERRTKRAGTASILHVEPCLVNVWKNREILSRFETQFFVTLLRVVPFASPHSLLHCLRRYTKNASTRGEIGGILVVEPFFGLVGSPSNSRIAVRLAFSIFFSSNIRKITK